MGLVNFKLANLSVDMESADKITNAEIRHRAEQYVVLITEAIRDINRELQDQNANKRRLEFRKANINNLKDACLGNFKNRLEIYVRNIKGVKSSSGTIAANNCFCL